jgi:nucleotide-binding universal stress UspA family protein
MKMLFCSDGSAAAENAVRFGALIAAGCHAETTILGICEQAGTEDALVQALRRSQELLKQHNLNAELITKDGRPVTEIVKRTRETPYDLVVIGAERRPGRTPALRSAKAYQIIEAVAPPVLVVVGERPVLRRVLLCSAGGAQAGKAVELTCTIAGGAKAEVTLFHVLAAPPAMFASLLQQEEDVELLLHSDSTLGRRLRQQQETLTQLAIACTVRLRHGLVVPELLMELRQAEYDLVVAGSSGARDPLRAYMLGNVTREIVNHAEWPVLIVRTGGEAHRWSDFVNRLFSSPTAPPESTSACRLWRVC